VGKKIEFRAAPKKPRAAKIAWERFAKQGAPHCMYFDSRRREWVATSGSGERRISQEDV